MQRQNTHLQSKKSFAHTLGVVLLLLMYMAQPVLAAQGSFCGCSAMGKAGDCGELDGHSGPMPVAEADSCCATKAKPAVELSCCSKLPQGGMSVPPVSESVCHCPLLPVDSAPNGVIFDGQTFEGPFAWWFDLETQANEWVLLAPHLGLLPNGASSSRSVRTAWPPGGLSPCAWGPSGLAPRRLQNSGLIAFLADLSVANL
ncbi:MAG: hypothetical protein JKY61_12600 [Planctomycetes bacterium]|nr:hypothetical protein [Planctomycetota bacterium]